MKKSLALYIPIVLARGVLKLLIGITFIVKLVLDSISAGINYFRATDFYKGLLNQKNKELITDDKQENLTRYQKLLIKAIIRNRKQKTYLRYKKSYLEVDTKKE